MSDFTFDGTLNTRIAFAQAKIGINLMLSDVSSEDMAEVMFDAEQSGYSDYGSCKHEPPALFQDEPALLQAWECGQNFAAEAEEMAECDSCNDGTGNPCPFHG